MAEVVLAPEHVSSGHLDEPIVIDLSASFDAGTLTTVIGPHGAGKSTLLRALYGLNRHFGGTIVLRGEAVQALPPAARLRRGIGFVPQGRCNFPTMSVAENLALGAYTLARAEVARAIERSYARFPVLAAKRAVLAGNMSGGEQQILETAMVLQARPTVLLLDEPSLGLSPANQAQVFDTIAGLRDEGLTVIVVEQNAHGALQISDVGIVMELGRVFMTGPAAQLLDDPRVRVAYLGGDPATADAGS